MNIPIRRYCRLLTSYLMPQWQRVAILAGLLGTSVALQLYYPHILRRFIDTAMAATNASSLPGHAALNHPRPEHPAPDSTGPVRGASR